MGRIWAHDLPAKLSAEGCPIDLQPGWELRSRSTGGFDNVLAVGIHHDAGSATNSQDGRISWSWYNSPSRPIGNMWIHTDGRIRFGCAGASNTQGKQVTSDRPVRTSKGVIDARWDTSFANRNVFSIEMSNNGVGQVWTKPQIETMIKALSVICYHFDLEPRTDIMSHWRMTSRKIDPRGPTPSHPSLGGSGADPYIKWDDNDVADLVYAYRGSKHQGDDVPSVVNQRLYDSRVPGPYSGKPATAGQVVTLNTGRGNRVVEVRVTTDQAQRPGWVKAWGDGGEPATTIHNYAPGVVSGGTALVDLTASGQFYLKFSAPTHFVVDVNAVY